MDALGFLKHVLDVDRLRVVGLVATAPSTVADLVKETGLREREVLAALGPLVRAEIVVRDGDRYRLVSDALRELAQDLPQPAPPSRQVFFGMTEEEGQILGRFFRGDRLVEIPMQLSKRRVVLERLALEFEPGVHYTEPEVNDTLGRFHPDYAALRRYLVDEGLLDRAEGEYWRAGGRTAL